MMAKIVWSVKGCSGVYFFILVNMSALTGSMNTRLGGVDRG